MMDGEKNAKKKYKSLYTNADKEICLKEIENYEDSSTAIIFRIN